MTLVEKLIPAGIDAVEYARGTAGVGAFVISVDPSPKGVGRLRVWEGTEAEIEVHNDKRRRQAVLLVKEPTRKIVRKVTLRSYKNRLSMVTDQFEAGNGFGMNLPSRTRYTLQSDITFTPDHGQLDDYAYGKFEATVRALVPKSTQTFLVGIDEEHHFVSALKKPVKSVLDAHEALRPPTVPKGSPRQGEWFFVPCSKRTSKQILAAVQEKPGILKERWLNGNSVHYRGGWYGDSSTSRLPSTTTHRATQTVRIGSNLYVFGYVLEDRETRHSPLFLHDWHLAVHNLEVQVPESTSSRSSSWD